MLILCTWLFVGVFCSVIWCNKRTNYCHSSLITLDGATLFSKVDSNKLRINVKNKMALIDAKFDADLINIAEVTSRKTKWPRFFGLPCTLRPTYVRALPRAAAWINWLSWLRLADYVIVHLMTFDTTIRRVLRTTVESKSNVNHCLARQSKVELHVNWSEAMSRRRFESSVDQCDFDLCVTLTSDSVPENNAVGFTYNGEYFHRIWRFDGLQFWTYGTE